jgi:hypothetical protein
VKERLQGSFSHHFALQNVLVQLFVLFTGHVPNFWFWVTLSSSVNVSLPSSGFSYDRSHTDLPGFALASCPSTAASGYSSNDSSPPLTHLHHNTYLQISAPSTPKQIPNYQHNTDRKQTCVRSLRTRYVSAKERQACATKTAVLTNTAAVRLITKQTQH